MGYTVTPKGADVLEILKVFEAQVGGVITLPEVDLEYEEIKQEQPIPEQLLPDVITNMVSLNLITYEPG